MPLPQFSRSGLTTLVFTKGVVYPYKRPVLYHQKRLVSGGGVVRVAKTGQPDRLTMIRFERLVEADYTGLRDWLEAVNASGLTFTFTDHVPVSRVVRWWDDTFDMEQGPGRLYAVTLTLRQE